MNEFRPVPQFRKYETNREGVIRVIVGKKVLKVRSDSHVNMIQNNGKNTTRHPMLLVKEIFKTDSE